MLKRGSFTLQVVWGLYANAKKSLYIVHLEINPSKKKDHTQIKKKRSRFTKSLLEVKQDLKLALTVSFQNKILWTKMNYYLKGSCFKTKVGRLRIRQPISISVSYIGIIKIGQEGPFTGPQFGFCVCNFSKVKVFGILHLSIRMSFLRF